MGSYESAMAVPARDGAMTAPLNTMKAYGNAMERHGDYQESP